MFSAEHPDWACRCCSPGATGQGPLESRWSVYVAVTPQLGDAVGSSPSPGGREAAVTPQHGDAVAPAPATSDGRLHRGRECSSQGPNFGHVATPKECDQLAASEAECGSAFMFSVRHPEWQCRCCAPAGADGGPSSDAWDVYRVCVLAVCFSSPIPTLPPVSQPFAGLPIVSPAPQWLAREDALVVDARANAAEGRASGGILIVQAVLADAGSIWGRQSARPQWLRAILATNRAHARRHGHAMILRAQPTQPQLTRWQLRQCGKKSTLECVKDNERENFNWEKHLMVSDYLMSPQNFSHILMLDADAALVQPSKDTLSGIADILQDKGVDLFMTNEDWLLYGENRINGGLMMAKNTLFTRQLFQDTFDAHIQGPKKLKNWRIGVDLMECSSNEQICLNELWSGSGRAHFAHKAMMASGKRYNRGAERGIDGLDVELMHWMGGSKGTAGRALCRGRGGDLTGEGPNGYGCRGCNDLDPGTVSAVVEALEARATGESRRLRVAGGAPTVGPGPGFAFLRWVIFDNFWGWYCEICQKNVGDKVWHQGGNLWTMTLGASTPDIPRFQYLGWTLLANLAIGHLRNDWDYDDGDRDGVPTCYPPARAALERLARAAALLAVGSGAEGPGPEGRWRPVFWEPVPFHSRPGHGEAAGRFGGEPRGARLEAHCDEWERSLAERTQQLRERAEAFRAQWDDQMIAFFHFIVFRLVSIQDAAAAAAPETPRHPGAAPRGAPGARPQAAGWSEVEVLVCVPGPLDSAASGFPVHKILWTSSGLSLVNVCERAAVVGQPEPLEALGMLATFLEQTRGQGQEPDGRLYLVVPWANAVFNALPAAAEAAEVVDRYERAAAEELGPGWAARGVAPPAVAAQEALQGGFGALAGPAEALAEARGGREEEDACVLHGRPFGQRLRPRCRLRPPCCGASRQKAQEGWCWTTGSSCSGAWRQGPPRAVQAASRGTALSSAPPTAPSTRPSRPSTPAGPSRAAACGARRARSSWRNFPSCGAGTARPSGCICSWSTACQRPAPRWRGSCCTTSQRTGWTGSSTPTMRSRRQGPSPPARTAAG
ncbi:unnamed protein product, partial [Prorocentrum cordatum]